MTQPPEDSNLVTVYATSLDLAATFADVAGQLAPRSVVTYQSDVTHFEAWLAENALDPLKITRSDFIQYRKHLAERYAKTTATRMLSVARRLYAEAVDNGLLAANPAERVKGFTSSGNETPHRALTAAEARTLLADIDRSTKMGQRDYALILLLTRTGLRRSEAADLTLADLQEEQGHHIVVVQHGKGDKRRVVKLPNDVRRVIGEYLVATSRSTVDQSAPLFVSFRKGDHPSAKGLRDADIGAIVAERAKEANIERLTPHGLRASFVTLALENGAKLQQVQYAVGHADPRTTERYQRRKLNLDDHAVDFIHL